MAKSLTHDTWESARLARDNPLRSDANTLAWVVRWTLKRNRLCEAYTTTARAGDPRRLAEAQEFAARASMLTGRACKGTRPIILEKRPTTGIQDHTACRAGESKRPSTSATQLSMFVKASNDITSALLLEMTSSMSEQKACQSQ